MKTILVAVSFIVFGCLSAFSQTPDTSKVGNKVLYNKELVPKIQSDSLKANALVPKAEFPQHPGLQEALTRIGGVQPVPMPTAKPGSKYSFSMPVAKPDSTVDFKLRIKKIGRPNP